MVECDKCKIFYHFECAKVDASVKDRDWSCATCVKKANLVAAAKANSPILPIPPFGKNTPPTTAGSTKMVIELQKANQQLKSQAREADEARDASQREVNDLTASQARDREELKKAQDEIRQLREQVTTLIQAARCRQEEDVPPTRADNEEGQHRLEPSPKNNRQISISSEDEIPSRHDHPWRNRPQLPRLNVSRQVPFDERLFTASILERVADMIKSSLPKSNTAPVNTLRDSPASHSHFSDFFDRGKSEASSSAAVLAASMNRKFIQALPKYYGEVRDWAYFESVYDSTTIQGKYSELENVNRLREALQPPASDMVRSLIMFPKSASAIMDELRDAYGRPELLNVALMNDVLKIRNSFGSEDTEQLRTLSLAVRNYVASMEAIGKPAQLYNDFAITSLAYKLSHQHQTEWEAQRSPTTITSLKTFSDFLLKKVKEIPPSLKLSSRALNPQTSRYENDSKRRRVMAHQQASPNPSGGESHGSSCLKCEGNHPMFKCNDFLKMTIKERYQFTFDNRVCSACLLSTAHRWKECPRKRVCGLKGCDKFHNRALHNSNPAPWNSPNNRQSCNFRAQQPYTERSVVSAPSRSQAFANSSSSLQHHYEDERAFAQPEANGPSTSLSTHQSMSHNSEKSVLFKIIPVRIHGENDEYVDTFAFLDDGSSLTLLDKEIHEKLRLKGSAEQLHLQWTNGIVRTEDSLCTTINISGKGGKKLHRLTNVYAVEHLDLPEQSMDVEALKNRYRHLRNLPLPEIQRAKPKILIGLQHAKFLLGTVNHVGNDDDPIASETQLGWTVFGNSGSKCGVVALTAHKNSSEQLAIHKSMNSDKELHHELPNIERIKISRYYAPVVPAETQVFTHPFRRRLRTDVRRHR